MARKTSGEEFVNHFNGVRLRVEGEGNLQTEFATLSNIKTQSLRPIAMLAATDQQEHRLANLKTEKAKFTFFVTELDEWFNIGRIIIFFKPVASSYPQR